MNQYDNEDRRKSERRVSPAAAEFALEERGELLDLIQKVTTDNQRLLESLATAKHRIEQGRVWNGTGWVLTGLNPISQQKAIDAIDAALAGSKEVIE